MPKIMQTFPTFVVKCAKTMEKAFLKLKRAFGSVYNARPLLDELRQYCAHNAYHIYGQNMNAERLDNGQRK